MIDQQYVSFNIGYQPLAQTRDQLSKLKKHVFRTGLWLTSNLQHIVLIYFLIDKFCLKLLDVARGWRPLCHVVCFLPKSKTPVMFKQ